MSSSAMALFFVVAQRGGFVLAVVKRVTQDAGCEAEVVALLGARADAKMAGHCTLAADLPPRLDLVMGGMSKGSEFRWRTIAYIQCYIGHEGYCDTRGMY